MAQFAGGRFRLAIKDRSGRLLHTGEAVEYDILDNSAQPRIVVNRGNAGLDQPYSFPFVAHGPEGEILCIQFLHTAATTPATASHVLVLGVVRAYKSGGKKLTDPDTLGIGNRTTKDTAGTTVDQRGLKDNTVTVANEWSDVVRICPDRHENLAPSGVWRFVYDAV